jgi:hypothetical protein
MYAKHADCYRLNDLPGSLIGYAFTVPNMLATGFLEKILIPRWQGKAYLKADLYQGPWPAALPATCFTAHRARQSNAWAAACRPRRNHLRVLRASAFICVKAWLLLATLQPGNGG